MADLPETGIAVLNALIGAPLAWQTPAQVAASLGCELEPTLDLLCDLDVAGWLDVWEDQNGPSITLSPLAAERLSVRIVEVGPGETPRWAGSGDPDPPSLRSRSVLHTERGATLDYVVDPMSAADFLSLQDPPDAADAVPQEGSRGTSRYLYEPWPTVLIGLGLTPWPGPGEFSKAECPACSGRTFRHSMYCLYCDRWGRDRPNVATPPTTRSKPTPSRENRAPECAKEDEQAQLERQRARRKSKRRRKHERDEQKRAKKTTFSTPSKRGESPTSPTRVDLGLSGPPRSSSGKFQQDLNQGFARHGRESTGIDDHSAG